MRVGPEGAIVFRVSKFRAAFLVVMLASGFGPAALSGRALSPETQSAVDEYLVELGRVEKSKSRVSMERLFLLAYSVRYALVAPVAAGAPSALEGLSEDELAATRGRLRGLLVERGEALAAVPDAAFFERLGERKGRTEDRLLLRLYRRTYGSSAWPVYVRQQTDFSACTDFGPGKLTKLYGEWSHYRSLHPGKYAKVVERELGAIVEELTRSECACGPSGSVQSELRYFLHRHPGSPAIPAVRARLNEVLHGEGKIRFNCSSG